MWHIDWNAVAAIASSVSAMGVLMVLLQMILYMRELRDDHDRSRRENAVSFILEWSKNLGRNASLTRKLVERLDADQIDNLINIRPIHLSSQLRSLVVGCLDGATEELDFEEEDEKIVLSESQVKILKWQAVSYLNLLEAILSAWRHNTADRDIIREQFHTLVAPEKGMTMLQNYRDAAGPGALPAISEFVRTILKERLDEKASFEAAELARIAGKPPIRSNH